VDGMRRGRPTAEVKLTAEERRVLERYVRRGTTAQRLAMRAQIVLLCADGLESKKVARRARTSANTVSKWRARFVEARLDGLLDEPRPGAPRKISDDAVEAIVVKTLEITPRGGHALEYTADGQSRWTGP